MFISLIVTCGQPSDKLTLSLVFLTCSQPLHPKVDKRRVERGKADFEEVIRNAQGDNETESEFWGDAIESDHHEEKSIDRLRDHGGGIVAEPQEFALSF